MASTNYKVGKNLGIVLAEIAQTKLFETLDLDEAANIFIESIGCDIDFAKHLVFGEYALVAKEEDSKLYAVKRNDLSEKEKKEYPILNATVFLNKLASNLNETTSDFYSNIYINEFKDVRTCLYDDINFKINSDISEHIFGQLPADVHANIHISARDIARSFVNGTDNETLKYCASKAYCTQAKGCLRPHAFIQNVSNIVYLAKNANKILSIIETFYKDKSFFNLTSDNEYKFYKLEKIIEFSQKMLKYIENDFEWTDELFND